MIYFKKLFSIILLIIPIYSLEVLANTINSSQKIYPPYPEVWGYDISDYPAIKTGEGGLRAYHMKDGDVWFVIDFDFKYKDSMKRSLSGYKSKEYVLIKFFKGEITKLSEDAFKKLINKISIITVSGRIGKAFKEIKFKDGSSLRVINESNPKKCMIPDYINNYILKLDSHGNKKKYSMLATYPYIELFEDEGYCEANAAPFIYQKLYFLGSYLINLGDDTFIVFSTGSNLILRFDKNFETKFKPQHPTTYFNGNFINRNFFVVEYDLVDKLQRDLSDKPFPLYQAVHDHLLLYLRKKYMSNQ